MMTALLHYLRQVQSKTMTTLLCCFVVLSTSYSATSYTTSDTIVYQALEDSIRAIVNSCSSEIGVGLIINDRDTIAINNVAKYPMMSVFKLHQALAVDNYLSRSAISIDSVVEIPRRILNPTTWSPMLKDYPDIARITISIRDLLMYSIKMSDNNASNYLFEHLLCVESVDKYIATLLPRESFAIKYSESEMISDHALAYKNLTDPLGAATLINLLYTDSILSNATHSLFIRQCLEECTTGKDRIVSPLIDEHDVRIGHKTGSGFRDNGVLAAHNDIGFIELPDKFHYSLAIFIKDYPGDEAAASAIIARISTIVYSALKLR